MSSKLVIRLNVFYKLVYRKPLEYYTYIITKYFYVL